MNHDQKLESILKQFPCPITYEPMRSDGLPKKDFFEWVVARLYRLENENRVRKKALELLGFISNKRDERWRDKK